MAKQAENNWIPDFSGRAGKRRLLEALKSQTLIHGSEELARQMLECGELLHHKRNGILTHQGGQENDIFLIISGEVSIRINNRQVAVRASGTHIGEMALTDPLARRSATAIAIEPTVTLRVPEYRFSKIARKHPDLWRRIAIEIAKRLRERSPLIRQPHNEPVLFIGSSSEGQAITDELYRYFLAKPVVPRPWTEGVFQASATSIESLVKAAQDADFAALVLTSDDVTISRGRKKPSPRDNVIFELGLFMGALGRERTFILKPKGVEVRIPSDLLGVVWLEYLRTGPKKERLSLTCQKMWESIQALGSR